MMYSNRYWDEYIDLTRQLTGGDYLEGMQQLALELDGKLFRYTEGIFDATKKQFCGGMIFAFFLAHFNQEKMNKSAIMRGLIDVEAAEAFQVVECEGWLAAPRKRDEMIAYASEKGKTEILAWLLDYKNRTADFAAEQEKADRKLMQELNCAPDSVLALKKLWSYQKQEDGTLLITNYKGTGVEVTVPERIGRSVVTTVGSAFSGMPVDQKLKINLPETLRCIGDCAFHRIEGLEEIRIPDGVESIGHFAFYECDQLQNIIIPDHVKEIGDHAFQGCSSLVHITIPAQTKSIGMSVFEGCSSLESAAISEGVKKLGSRVFWKCSSLKSVTIPSTVERISPDAFFMCSQLVEVKLCEGVRGIGRDAFEGCVLLTDITIPRSVEEIGAYAFADCQALAELDIRGRIRELGESVFSECSALTEFMIPKTVEKIGDYAFSGCASLKSITIPAAVTEIGKGVFAGCSNLEEVCICGEVKKLGAEAFVNCTNLRMIRIRESIPNRILGETFEQQKGLTVSCPKGSRTEAYCKKKGISCIIN